MTVNSTLREELEPFIKLVMERGVMQEHCLLTDSIEDEVNRLTIKLEALIQRKQVEARVDELERIKKSVDIVETEDYEYPYMCESCHMMMQEEDDLCGCEYAIRDRLAELNKDLKEK